MQQMAVQVQSSAVQCRAWECSMLTCGVYVWLERLNFETEVTFGCSLDVATPRTASSAD